MAKAEHLRGAGAQAGFHADCWRSWGEEEGLFHLSLGQRKVFVRVKGILWDGHSLRGWCGLEGSKATGLAALENGHSRVPQRMEGAEDFTGRPAG